MVCWSFCDACCCAADEAAALAESNNGIYDMQTLEALLSKAQADQQLATELQALPLYKEVRSVETTCALSCDTGLAYLEVRLAIGWLTLYIPHDRTVHQVTRSLSPEGTRLLPCDK